MFKPKVSLVQSTANSNSLNAAIALSEVGLLHEVITTLAYNPNGNIAQFLKILPQQCQQKIEQELARRIWTVPKEGAIRSHAKEELLRLLFTRTGWYKSFNLNRRRLIDWVYLWLDRHAANHHTQGIDAIYGYEDESAFTFQTAKQKGIYCFYEQPSTFYSTRYQLEQSEAERFPELASVLQVVQEPTWKIERKKQEVQLADHIFVPSSFCKQSLVDLVEPEKITVIPYGAPVNYFQVLPKPDRVFRALYVGRISPHKGIQYILKSWQELKLPDGELLFVGSNLFPDGWLSSYEYLFRHVSSVPHRLLNQYYSSASVLVFASLAEGLSLVQLEAMACGIPLITTHNAGGTDIITDGVEGFIVPIRDVEAIKEKLEWCYQHPEELAEMGKAARRKAEKLTWDVYRQQLASRVQEILAESQKVQT